jgi:hypothetical protein
MLLARNFVVQPLPEHSRIASNPPLAEDPHQENDDSNPAEYIETSVTTLVILVVHADLIGRQ